jgi:Na+/H+ antiporter NhaD/arsenite permease-like protein
LIVLVFIIGYILIALENVVKVNKSLVAVLMGIITWLMVANFNASELFYHSKNNFNILVFLFGAIFIIALIEDNNGFDFIANQLTTKHTQRLMITVSLITFLLSAILDNLTTTIIMISIVKKLVSQHHLRKYLAGLMIIAANAGGSFSPIGDVTTTMLWVGGQITEWQIIKQVFLPALVCIVIPVTIGCLLIKDKHIIPVSSLNKAETTALKSKIILLGGMIILVGVPILKSIFNWAPSISITLGAIILSLLSGYLNIKSPFILIKQTISKVDFKILVFFFGLLMCISALEADGQLQLAANFLFKQIPNVTISTISLGFFSAVIDNVPLVAAVQGMFDNVNFPKDHHFWHLLAYCTGTGGSLLVIGSAAGVAAMGQMQLDFMWYLKNMSWLALLGYLAGMACMLLMTV